MPALRPEAASRHFTSGGSEWIARAVGRVSIGRARSGSAHFMLVTFSRAENPDAAALELLVEGRELTRFGELELSELLTRARPYSGASRKPGIFPEIRSGKKDER